MSEEYAQMLIHDIRAIKKALNDIADQIRRK
jgi:hypothetical protein